MKLPVLQSFPFKGKRYPKGGYILSHKFKEHEISAFVALGFIEAPPAPKPPSKKQKKTQSKKEESKDNKEEE